MHTLSTIAALCGNHNHTVGTTSTVDGCCRSVLQHLDRLDIVRVEKVEVAHCHAVYNVERTCRSIDGSDTTDDNAHLTTRLTCIAEDVDTSSLTLQTVKGVERLLLDDVGTLSVRYRTCKVGLTHCTVTYYYQLVKSGILGFQHHVEFAVLSLSDRNLLAQVAQIREHQCSASGSTDRIFTVDVGDCSRLCAFHTNGTAYDQFAFVVGNGSGNCLGLGIDCAHTTPQ